MQRPNVKPSCAMLQLLPAVLLTACATASTPSAPICPAIPSPPQLRQPIPQQSYSDSARTDIETWQKRLIGMQLTR